MGGRGQRKDKTTAKFMQALLGVTLAAHANPPPAVPEECKRAKELYSQFINKGKRAKAWKELEALLRAKPSSALCITAAKMHMIAAVEQVCKVEDDAAREAAGLAAMHRVLEFAVRGALQYCSIQCLVLAVFTLHTCRGRGTNEQVAWRLAQAQELEARFGAPAAQPAKWGKTKWVDPRLESYEKDRFPFEWEPYSSKNLKEWIEAVRDDWNKFMPTVACADRLATEHSGDSSSSSSSSRDTGGSASGQQQQQQQGAGAEGGGSPEELLADASLREEIATPVDVRLAGSFALKHCDKEAIRRHLDALDAKRKGPSAAGAGAAGASGQAPQPPPKPAPTPASTRAGRAATAAAAAAVVQLAAAAGKDERGGLPGVGSVPPLPPAAAVTAGPYHHSRGGGLADSSPLLLPGAGSATGAGAHGSALGKGRERHRAEQKRQQAQRAQQRAAEIQAYLQQQLGVGSAAATGGAEAEAAQRALAASCSMGVDEFVTAVRAATAAKELTQAEADLALANVARLRGTAGAAGASGAQQRQRHVWYGDPHLDTTERRHEVRGQDEMEELLTEHLQQDWVVADEATEWVGSHLDGWRELLTRMGLEANTMTDVDRDSMLAQENPALGQTLVRVWTEDYVLPPPPDVGAEVDEAADAELEALLPAGARPCSCGRCQREQQQQQPAVASAGSASSSSGGGGSGGAAATLDRGAPANGSSNSSSAKVAAAAGDGCSAAAEPSTPTKEWSGAAPKRGSAGEVSPAAAAAAAAGAHCRADAAAQQPGSSPTRVQLAQQQWREAMYSEEYGSVLQLDVYINEAERSQQYLDSILGRPEGLMQQCRVLAANPEGAPSNEADELVRRAVVGHLMLRLAGAWDEPEAQQQRQQAPEAQGTPAAPSGAAVGEGASQHSRSGRVTETLHLLRRAMDPSCDLESLIMDCAVDEAAGQAAVHKLGQLREAELAAEAAASKAWAELAAAMQTQDGSSGGSSGGGVVGCGTPNGSAVCAALPSKCTGGMPAEAAAAGQHMTAGLLPGSSAALGPEGAGGPMEAREDDGAISRPVTFCTPLLTTVLEGTAAGASSRAAAAANAGSSSSTTAASAAAANSHSDSSRAAAAAAGSWEQERQRLLQVKGQLARSALRGLGTIWNRRRLTDKMSFQLCQFIADSLATCGELSSRPAERDVLRRAAERLLVGPAPAPCVLRLAGWLPLRVLRHLYTFVALLVGECFASPQDLSEGIEDLVYADASAGALSEDGTTITVRPAVFAALTPVQPCGVQVPFMDGLGPEPLGRRRAGRADPFLASSGAGEVSSLAEALRGSGTADALGCDGEGGSGGGPSNWVARVAAYVCAPSEAQQAQQAQQEGGREEVVGDLHKLWHVEGVLLGLANLCEYWERGLDDSLARMEALRATLEQVVAGCENAAAIVAAAAASGEGEGNGTQGSSAADRGPFMLEQQLLEARRVLQATEAVELSLRLAVIKMHGVCFEDVLGMLRERSAELDIKDDACLGAAISKFECMLRDSSTEGKACRARMQELAVAPAPALEGKELETVRALSLVLGGSPASQNGQRPAPHKVRALLAARPERWEASLAAGRELVLSTLRRLDECTEALATLGEWCYIKQCSLIGQLRGQYCTHSCGDEVVGVLLRLLATQRWEPAILAEQERERRALAQALETELEAEREREAQSKAARKAQRAKQKAALHAAADAQAEPSGSAGTAGDELASPSLSNGDVGSSGSSSSGEEEEEAEEETGPSKDEAFVPQESHNGEGDWVAEMLARQRPPAALTAAPSEPSAKQQPPEPGSQPKLAKQHSAKQQQQQPKPREVMRVVSYLGDWMCHCGQVRKLWDPCSCGQEAPCRDWVRGVCTFAQCRFPHPPFDLPPTTHLKRGDRIANPTPDAPLYGQSAAAAAKQAQLQQKRTARPGVAAPSSSSTFGAHLALATAAHAAAKGSAAAAAAAAATRSLGSSSSSGSLTSSGPPAGNAWAVPPPGMQQQQQQQQVATAGAAPPQSFAAAVAASAGADGAERPNAWAMNRGSSLNSLAVQPPQPPVQPPAQPPAQSPQPPSASANGSTAPCGRASPTPIPASAPAAAAAAAAVLAVGTGVGTGLASAAAGLPPGAAVPGPPSPHAQPAAPQPFAIPVHALPMPAVAPMLRMGLPAGGLVEACLCHSSRHSPWGSAGGLATAAECAEEAGSDQEDASLFSCFNTQVLQGLGLDGPEDFNPLPAAASLEPPHRTATPPSLPTDTAGEDNSLLASIVLCLWHCAEFREQVRSWPAVVYMGHPVVKALHALFHALAEAQLASSSSSSNAPPDASPPGLGPLHAVAAGELKEALSALPGQLVPPGVPCEPGSLLLNVYERIREVAAMRGILPLADTVFGTPLAEAVQCRSCGRVTRQAAYVQYLLPAQAAALREQQRSMHAGESASLGRMLRLIEESTNRKSCDKEAGGCGAVSAVSQVVQGAPRVFTLQLGWAKEHEAAADIAATLGALREQVDLADLYLDLVPRRFVYRLRSMVCASGDPQQQQRRQQHSAFVLLPELGGWVLYEEHRASVVGGWQDVVARCEAASIQPSVLFYVGSTSH